jgi:NAD(P)-dependent dehydrogenase (short-subunit alcohol dehydrogenase family)
MILKGKTAIVTGLASGIGIATTPAAAGSFAGGLTRLLAGHRGSILPD